MKSVSIRELAVASLIAAVASGCSLIADIERTQCGEPADCAKALGGDAASYVCESNLCRTLVECETNQQCTSASEPLCVAGSCVQCINDDECGGTSVCVANACVDEVWGCLNETDKRPAPTQPSATITLNAIDPVMKTPLSSLNVRACLDHIVLPGCDSPAPMTTSLYDAATGAITVSLPQNSSVYVKMDAPMAYQSVSYFSNRPVRDTEAGGVINFIPPQLLSALAGGAQFPIDAAKPTAYIRVFNCKGETAEGVIISMKDPPSDLITAYIETDAPRFDLTATSPAGTGGFFNLPSGALVKVTARISHTQAINFEFVPAAGRAHSIDLHPGKFTAK